MWTKVALATLVFGIVSSNTRVRLRRESPDFSPLNNDDESASGEDVGDNRRDTGTSSATRPAGINISRAQTDLGLSFSKPQAILNGGQIKFSHNLVESATPVTLQEIQTDVVVGQKTSIKGTTANNTTSGREKTRAPIKTTRSYATSATSSSVGSSQSANTRPHFGGSFLSGLSKSSTLSSSPLTNDMTSNPKIIIPFPNPLTSSSYSRVIRNAPNPLTSSSYSRVIRNALATVVPEERETSHSSASSTLPISSSSINNGLRFNGLPSNDSSKTFVSSTTSFVPPQSKTASRLIALGQPAINPLALTITTNRDTINLSSSANSSSKASPMTGGTLIVSGSQVPSTPSFSPLSSEGSLPSNNAVSQDGLPSAEGSTDTIGETLTLSTISQPRLGLLASTSTSSDSTTETSTGNASMNVAATGKETNRLPVIATLPFSPVDTSSTDSLQPRSAVSRLGSALPTGLSQTTSSSSVSSKPLNPISIFPFPLGTALSSSLTSSSSRAGTAKALRVGQPVLVPESSAITPTRDSSTALPSMNLQPGDKTTHTSPATLTAEISPSLSSSATLVSDGSTSGNSLLHLDNSSSSSFSTSTTTKDTAKQFAPSITVHPSLKPMTSAITSSRTSSALSSSTSTSPSRVIEKAIKIPTENTAASFSSATTTTTDVPVVVNSVPESDSSSTPITTINGSAQAALGKPALLPVSSALTSGETSTLSTRAKTDVFSSGGGKKAGAFSSGSGKKADVFSSGSGSSKTFNVGTSAGASSDTVSSKSFNAVSGIGAASTAAKTLSASRSSSSTSKATKPSALGAVDKPVIVTPSSITSRQGLPPASVSLGASSDLTIERKGTASLQDRTSSGLSPAASLAGTSTFPNAGNSGNPVGSSTRVISASLSEQQTQEGNVVNFATDGRPRFFGTVPPSSIASIAIPIPTSSVNVQPRTGAAVAFGNNAPLFFSSIPTVQAPIPVLPSTPTGFLIGGQNNHAIAHGQSLAINNPLTFFNIPGLPLTGFHPVHG